MSYTSSLPKIQPAPLTLKTLPKYISFIKKHGETPGQYIERMNKQQTSSLIDVDVKSFLSKEKALGSRRKSQILKSNKINNEQDMKEVTYFNTDLQKYVTTKIPANISIIPKKERVPLSFDLNIPELDYSDLYDVTPTSGGAKKRISKKRSGTVKKRSGTIKKRISKKRSGTIKKRISKKRSGTIKKRISKKRSGTIKKRISKKRSGTVKKRSGTVKKRSGTVKKRSGTVKKRS
jgi:hypothetical protein